MVNSTRRIVMPLRRGQYVYRKRRLNAFTPISIASLTQWLFATSGLSSTEVLDNRSKDTSRKPQVGRCYDFDGVDDYVDFTACSFSGVSSYEIDVWFNTTTTNEDFFLSDNDTGTDGVTVIVNSTGEVRVKHNAVSAQTVGAYNDGNWYRGVFSWDGATLTTTVYNSAGVEQETVSSSVATAISTTSNVRWGSYSPSVFKPYGGKARDLKITTNGTLKLWCKADEGAGSTAYDSSGNGNHGTITNATLLSFHATDTGVTYSYQNEVGYSEGVNLIPYESSYFDTDGTSYWSPVRSTISYNASGWLTFTATDAVPGVFRSNLLTAGALHKVKFKAKCNQASGSWKSIGDNNNTDVTILNPNITTDWQDYEFDITPTGTLFRLYLDGISTDIVDIDEIQVRNLSEGFLPRNESNTSQDVLGNTLDYTGQVAYPAKLVESNCGTFDGVDDYVVKTTGSYLNSIVIATRFKTSNVIQGSNFRLWGSDDSAGTTKEIRTTGVSAWGIVFSGMGFYVNINQLDLTNNQEYELIVKAIQNGSDVDWAIYLDGVEMASGTELSYTLEHSSTNLTFGAWSTNYYTGSMYDIAVWTADKTLAQIQSRDTTDMYLHLPIAEGSGTNLYDVSGNSNHGTATNITPASFWANTQDTFHWNITKGFRGSAGVKVPALADGSNAANGNPITNPAGKYHNNAETKIQQYDSPAMRLADTNNYWFNGATINAKGYADIVANVNSDDKIFADVATADKYKNILSFSTALTGADLANVKSFTNQ